MSFRPIFRLLKETNPQFALLSKRLNKILAKTKVQFCLLDDTGRAQSSVSIEALRKSLKEYSHETEAFSSDAVLCGTSRDIYALSLSVKSESLQPAALLLFDTPLTPFARKYLSASFKAPLLEILFDENALPLALDCGDGTLEPLLEEVEWLALDRFGVRQPNDAWGRLACIKDKKLIKVGLNAQVYKNRAGRYRLKCAGLEDAGLSFSDGRMISLPELHRAFSAFEIFDYRIRQDLNGYSISASSSENVEKAYLESRLKREFPAMFPGIKIDVVAAENLPEGERIAVDKASRPREVFIWRSEENGIPAAIRANISHENLKELPVFDAYVTSRDPEALDSVIRIFEGGQEEVDTSRIVIYGVQPEIAAFNICSAPPAEAPRNPIICVPGPCANPEKVKQVCPCGAIGFGNGAFKIDEQRCIRCYICVEQYSEHFKSVINSNAVICLNNLAEYLNNNNNICAKHKVLHDTIRRVQNKYTSSFKSSRTVVLGLACVTLTENSAALLIDGKLVAAVEEERLQRVKHYGWTHPERPGSSLASDPLLRLHEPLPVKAIQSVLDLSGLCLKDVDAIALNGLPYRLRHSYSKNEPDAMPQILREGALFFVPHHLAHAASTFCMSGFERAFVLSIDGRGDRETLALFEAEGDSIKQVADIPYEPDRSIGGVYETFTRILGFGNFGQGSTMALAAFGNPEYDLAAYLSFDDPDKLRLSEWKSAHDFESFRREYSDPLELKHKNLAASIQNVLEGNVLKLLKKIPLEQKRNLCICGGVGLNCRMNGRIMEESGAENIFIPPGANDAGTAIGAAFMAHYELTGDLARQRLSNAFLGPEFLSDDIGEWLKSKRITARRMENIGTETARLLADSKIVCWFSGRMEFGPRALGARSILADPRQPKLKDRLNTMKSRQNWRPFGVSIMEEHQAEWFEHSIHSLFMLLALSVKPEKRSLIPVAVHADGSSRPQSIVRADHPRYYAVIEEFNKLTGIPILVNTSFNRGGEPIVCTPAEAFVSFVRMGADALVLEDWLILRENLR